MTWGSSVGARAEGGLRTLRIIRCRAVIHPHICSLRCPSHVRPSGALAHRALFCTVTPLLLHCCTDSAVHSFSKCVLANIVPCSMHMCAREVIELLKQKTSQYRQAGQTGSESRMKRTHGQRARRMKRTRYSRQMAKHNPIERTWRLGNSGDEAEAGARNRAAEHMLGRGVRGVRGGGGQPRVGPAPCRLSPIFVLLLSRALFAMHLFGPRQFAPV